MFDSLLFFDMNPIHIGLVLLIALLLFGPQKLPDIGKQIGNALRELKKAGSDMVNSFNTDHDPNHTPYNNYDYNYPTEAENSVYRSPSALPAVPDLSDYTIAGQPVTHQSSSAHASMDYAIAGSGEHTGATAVLDSPARGSEALAESHKEGTSHV